MLQTTVSVDVGQIFTALAPVVAVLTTAWIASKTRKKDKEEAILERKRVSNAAAAVALEQKHKLEGIHTLVNDNMTREKGIRLADMEAQLIVVTQLIGPTPDADKKKVIGNLITRIDDLKAEIAKRDEAASSLTSEQK